MGLPLGTVVWLRGAELWGGNLPTLTAVLLSSSDALLPPPSLLLMLRRLELRFERIMALMGRGTPFAGDPGGEVAIACGYGSAVVCEGVVRCPLGWNRRIWVCCIQVQSRRRIDWAWVVAPSGIRVVLCAQFSLMRRARSVEWAREQMVECLHLVQPTG